MQLRAGIAPLLFAAGLLTLGVSAQGATHSMTGHLNFLTPSTNFTARGPMIRGGQTTTIYKVPMQGATAPITAANATWGPRRRAAATVSQTGVFPHTLKIPAGVWSVTAWPNMASPSVATSAVPGGQNRGRAGGPGTQFLPFTAFPGVAQLTRDHLTSQPSTLSFMAGGGAAAGGTIDWCPKITPCLTYTNGNVAQARILIGGNGYGGTVELIQKVGGQVFFVPKTSPPITISQNQNPIPTLPWTPGVTNNRTIIDVNPAGLLFQGGSLTTNGRVAALGAFVGSGGPNPQGTGTGFQMTTGSIFVVDATPPTGGGGPFSTTITGSDARTAGGNGNITLLGGAVIYGGVSGNNFFRISILDLALPEPQAAAGLAAGAAALIGLAVVRRRMH